MTKLNTLIAQNVTPLYSAEKIMQLLMADANKLSIDEQFAKAHFVSAIHPQLVAK